jgi:ATP-dependent RNA helicase RhlE
VKDFKSLGLADPLLRALDDAGYNAPTPIQTEAIPLVLDSQDLLGIAQTGTGKTAAFALPILDRLEAERRRAPAKGCRALVLAPTRELASQIAESFRVYGRHLRLEVVTIFGGVSPRPQFRALSRGIDILVATPGRLIDHMSTGAANLANTEILVLDEADQMLDLGFAPSLRRIVAALPEERQTLFFSATMPKAVSHLAAAFLNNPKRVSVTPVGTPAERVEQRVIHVGGAQKRVVLTNLLTARAGARTLVFTRTKRGADKLARYLDTGDFSVAAIHGNKTQKQRERALQSFRDGRIDILIATDIAARGIDIDGIRHVINFELPDVPEAYVHRIGRTARAGGSGHATSLCDPSQHQQLRDIEKLIRQKIAVEYHDEPSARAEAPAAPPRTSDRVSEPRRKRKPAAAKQSAAKQSADGRHGSRDRSRGKPGARPGEGGGPQTSRFDDRRKRSRRANTRTKPAAAAR